MAASPLTRVIVEAIPQDFEKPRSAFDAERFAVGVPYSLKNKSII